MTNLRSLSCPDDKWLTEVGGGVALVHGIASRGVVTC